jgi:6,7-dimethyl-8-ribityllumazine synthase
MAGHGKLNVRLGGRNGLSAEGLRFGIVVSDFNNFVTDRLLAGALEALAGAGARKEQIEVARVPGAFELPIAAKKMAATKRFDSIISIGCVLRGETSHYDYVCSETARGIQLAQLDTGVPIGFCVLTCDTREQALARAGENGGNKGYEVAVGAIEMARFSRKYSGNGGGAATVAAKPAKRGNSRGAKRRR